MAQKPTPGAARTDGNATALEPGLIARATQGVRYLLTGKVPDGWMGPSQPLPPLAQDEARGRQWDFPVGVNIRQQPRSGEPVTFPQLRALADSWDLLRLAIETRKDQMAKLAWVIRPKDLAIDPDDRCQQATDFFAFPDKEHDWATWLRMILEDLFVLDAPTIYPRRTRGGDLYCLDLIDGATIKRVIDADGRTPVPPDPAYQQVIKGLTAVDYSRDELLYLPRNPRTNRLYGYSPVEQIIVTVNIAIRRQITQLQYYTEGNVPDAFGFLPENWQPDQVKQFQEYWDALYEGNTAQRRKMKWLAGKGPVQETRDPKLKDEYDEWLARVVCYCFSLPPTAFVKQMNRATSDTAQEVAVEEGLGPLMQWTKGVVDQVLWRWFGWTDLEMDFEPEAELDQLTKAQVDQIYVEAKVVTPDEVRESLGKDPLTAQQKDELNPPPPPGLAGPDGKPLPGAKPAPFGNKVSKKNGRRRLTVNDAHSRSHGTHSARY